MSEANGHDPRVRILVNAREHQSRETRPFTDDPTVANLEPFHNPQNAKTMGFIARELHLPISYLGAMAELLDLPLLDAFHEGVLQTSRSVEGKGSDQAARVQIGRREEENKVGWLRRMWGGSNPQTPKPPGPET